jgi:hypothetical protein
VSGRRGIDDDELESWVGGQPVDLDQRRHFVNAWQGQRQQLRDILCVEPRAAESDPLECGAPRGEPAVERLARVDLDGVEGGALRGNSPRLMG